MSRFSRLISAWPVVIVGLTACASPAVEREASELHEAAAHRRDAVIGNLPATSGVRGSAELANQLAPVQAKPKVMRSASRSWVGSVMMPVNSDDKLPATFSSEYVLNFADGKAPLPLAVVAARLSQIVGMPVRIQQDVYSAADSSAGVAAGATVSGNSVAARAPVTLTAASMNWRGNLTGFLDHLTDQLGLSWEYRDGSIVIMRFTTELYEIATFPNAYNYTMNSGASGSSAGEGVRTTSQLTVAEQGTLNGLSSVVAVVKKMVEAVPGSEVLIADGSGRLMVKTSKDAQSSVREFIRAENANMLRQVQIQLDIYSVSTSKSNELGVDWAAFYRNLAGNFSLGAASPATLTGINSGSVNALVLPGGSSDVARRFANSSVVINALNQVGSNVQHRPISLVALNRQWARKARLNTTGFLSETRPAPASALGGGAGVPGLTTSSITTGDQYAVMPFILENNTVMLKMGLSLSDLLGLFEVTTGSGETLQRVQTPNTSSISDQYTIALKPGEVMAITGLSRDVSSNDNRTLSEELGLGFGGSKTSNIRRENFLVFIRAVLL